MTADELRDELEGACLDAMAGDPPGPLMATRLQRTCIDVLRRLRVTGARVSATSNAAGTQVRVVLPPAPGQVRELVLRLA